MVQGLCPGVEKVNSAGGEGWAQVVRPKGALDGPKGGPMGGTVRRPRAGLGVDRDREERGVEDQRAW